MLIKSESRCCSCCFKWGEYHLETEMIPHKWCTMLIYCVWCYLYVSKATWNSRSGSACPMLCRLLDVWQYFMMVNGTEKWFFIWKHKEVAAVCSSAVFRPSENCAVNFLWSRPAAVSGQWWPCFLQQRQSAVARKLPPAALDHGCCRDGDPVCPQRCWRSRCIQRELRVQKYISHDYMTSVMNPFSQIN